MSYYRFLLISTLAAGLATAAFAEEGGGAIGTQSGSQSQGGSQGGTQSTATVTRNYTFAPVALSSTETVRVIVVNTATAPTTTSSTTTTAPSCTGKITFLSSASTPPTVSPVSFTIGAGQFAFADLPYAKSGISTSPGEVLGKVESDVSVSAHALCSLGMSLVVMDTTTGATHAVLGSASMQGSAFVLGNR